MSQAPNDGGPAFPGMSLRDYFAGQALAGIMASCHEMLVRDAARWAYEQADAMLEIRSEQSSEGTGAK